MAAFASRRKGLATTAQLLALGVSESGIRRRVTRGWLHRVHPGVYAVGHTFLSGEARWLAAVLACGERAVLSHRSAAALWGIRPVPGGRIEVTVPGGGRPGPRPVHVHRTRCLADEDVTARDDIPVTSVARTLVDLSEVLGPRQLRYAVNEAEVRELLDVDAVWRAAARVSGRRRLTRLIRLLGISSPPVRSVLERRFLELCAAGAIPAPQVDVPLHGFLVDFFWPGAKLIVETDGARVHSTRATFEADRRRDAELTAAGYRVVRFTWRQVTEDPAAVVRVLRRLLGVGG